MPTESSAEQPSGGEGPAAAAPEGEDAAGPHPEPPAAGAEERRAPPGAQAEGTRRVFASPPPAVCPQPLGSLSGGDPDASTPADCPVCFSEYGVCRPPKLLRCQHAFCAVCLKLMLRRDGAAWSISCPLCRKPTAVAGGLVRTLQDKRELVESWEKPQPDARERGAALGAGIGALLPEDAPADNGLALQRLLLLLLLLLILAILILPFLRPGLLKWGICLTLGLGLLMATALCCTPRLRCGCAGDPRASCRKETRISAIA